MQHTTVTSCTGASEKQQKKWCLSRSSGEMAEAEDDVEVHGDSGKRKKICVNPYMGAQHSQEVSAEIVLPDELWAKIFSKVEDGSGWREASRLACLSRQFARVLKDWKSIFARRVSFNCQVRRPKILVRIARTFGEHVRELKVLGAISSDPVGVASRHCLENALQYMPILEELDASSCLLAGGTTVLSILVEIETLRAVQLSVAVSNMDTPMPKFVFSSKCRKLLERLARECSLSLAFVAPAAKQIDTISCLNEDAGLAEQLTSLEVSNSTWRPGLCGVLPGCVQAPLHTTQQPASVTYPVRSVPFLRHSYKRLCRLVVYGFTFPCSDLLEMLRNAPHVTHLNVGASIHRGRHPDRDFFEEFSSLPNKFVCLNTARWDTNCDGRMFAEMVRCFPTLREFSYQCQRTHYPPLLGLEPGSVDWATLLVDACPNLTSLSVGTDMGVPGLDMESAHILHGLGTLRSFGESDFGPIPALRALSNLRALSLTSVALRSVNDIRLLAEGCPQLEELKLCALGTSPTPYIPYLSVALRSLTLLRTLAVADVRFSVTGFFEELANLQCLQSLALFTRAKIADKVLVEYVKSTAAPLDFMHITCDGLKKDLCALVKTLHSMRPHGKVLVRHEAHHRGQSFEASHGFKWEKMWRPPQSQTTAPTPTLPR